MSMTLHSFTIVNKTLYISQLNSALIYP